MFWVTHTRPFWHLLVHSELCVLWAQSWQLLLIRSNHFFMVDKVVFCINPKCHNLSVNTKRNKENAISSDKETQMVNWSGAHTFSFTKCWFKRDRLLRYFIHDSPTKIGFVSLFSFATMSSLLHSAITISLTWMQLCFFILIAVLMNALLFHDGTGQGSKLTKVCISFSKKTVCGCLEMEYGNCYLLSVHLNTLNLKSVTADDDLQVVKEIRQVWFVSWQWFWTMTTTLINLRITNSTRVTHLSKLSATKAEIPTTFQCTRKLWYLWDGSEWKEKPQRHIWKQLNWLQVIPDQEGLCLHIFSSLLLFAPILIETCCLLGVV